MLDGPSSELHGKTDEHEFSLRDTPFKPISTFSNYFLNTRRKFIKSTSKPDKMLSYNKKRLTRNEKYTYIVQG